MAKEKAAAKTSGKGKAVSSEARKRNIPQEANPKDQKPPYVKLVQKEGGPERGGLGMRRKSVSPNEALQELRIRPVERKDILRIREIILSTGNFNEEEVRTALELVDEFLAKGLSSGYIVSVLESGEQVEGYVCYGPTPLTDGVYDLYWIAVDSASQGKGYGKYLLRYVEDDVLKRGGRMLVIETSSQEKYGPTIQFYEAGQYEQAARIRNFYRIGDDKLIYIRELK